MKKFIQFIFTLFFYFSSINVFAQAPVTVTLNSTDLLCKDVCDGTANAIAADGDGTYSYSWSGPNGFASSAASISGLCAGFYAITVTDGIGDTASASLTITEPSSALTVSIFKGDATASNNDGFAIANPSGGTPFPGPSYNYAWSPAPAAGQTTPTVGALNAGPYEVTVTDQNGCTAIGFTTITAPGIFTVSASVLNDVTCNGFTDGSAKAEPNGGTGPYSYAWSPSGAIATNVPGNHTVLSLVPGIHSVTITDATSATASASVFIAEPSLMTFGASTATHVSCNAGANGTGAVSITSGGEFPLAYYWPAPAVKSSSDNTGSTAGQMSAGLYIVTVTDNKGCSQVAPSITITEPTAVEIDSVSFVPPICVNSSDGSATVYVKPGSGTPGYTYTWGTSPRQYTQTATGLRGIAYVVSVFDANLCLAKTTVTVGLPAPVLVSTTVMPVNCNGANSGSITATASSGTSPYTYSWTQGINTCTTTAAPCTKTGLAVGTYYLTVTDANNCFTTNTTMISTEAEPIITKVGEGLADCPGPNGYVYVNYSTGFNISWVPDPVSLGGSFSNDTLYAPPGTYKAVLTSQLTACVDTFPFLISAYIRSKPIIRDSTTVFACEGQAYTFDSPSIPMATYKWLHNGSEIPAAVDSIYNASLAGGYQVIKVLTCGEDTSIIHTLQIDSTSIKGIPITPAGDSLEMCDLSTLVLKAPGYNNYDWREVPFGAGIPDDSLEVTYSGSFYVLAESANGCSGSSDTIVVTAKPVPIAPVIIPLTTISICQGQNAMMEVQSPLAGEVYEWSTTELGKKITVSPPDTTFYYVVATGANGCKKASSIKQVRVKPLPAANLKNKNDTTICFGNPYVLKFIPPPPASYQFKWSDGSSKDSLIVTETGDYWVTVTNTAANNGCSRNSDTVRVIVNQGAIIPVTSSKTDLDICLGDSVILKAAPGFVSYKWSNNATTQEVKIKQAINDLYVIGYKSDGCAQKSAKHTVTINPYPPVPTVTRNAAVLTSSASSNNQWYKNGIAIPGATLQTYTVTQNGSYTVRVNNGLSCYSESSPIQVIVSGISSAEENYSLKIYPNPFKDKAKIQYELAVNSIVKLEVYNILGEKVITLAEGKQAKGLHNYEFSQVKPGIYFVRLIVDGKVLTQRLTKN